MTHSTADKTPQHDADRAFPYVLVYGTLGAIISLGAVWISSMAFMPLAGA